MYELYRNGSYFGKANNLTEARQRVEADKQHTLACVKQGWINWKFDPSRCYWDIRNDKVKYFERITF